MTIYRGAGTSRAGSVATVDADIVVIDDDGNLIDATNVEDALQEVATSINTDEAALAAHIADTTTHGTTGDVVGTTDTQSLTNKTVVVASNTITTAASGNLVATELNAALAELDGQDTTLQSNIDTVQSNVDTVSTNLSNHINDITAAHAASAIGNTPAGNIAATDVQAAINELDTEKQPLDATLTALAGTLTAANKVPYATAIDTAGELDFLDEDTLVSNSATAVASQQSIKAYVDTSVAAVGGGAWELIESWTPTAVTFKDFTWDEAVYSEVMVVGTGLAPATDNDFLLMRLGYNDGASIITNSQHYGTGETWTTSTYQSPATVYSGTAYIPVSIQASVGADGVGSAAGEGVSFCTHLSGLSSNLNDPVWQAVCTYRDNGGLQFKTRSWGTIGGGVADSLSIDTVRVYWNTGNYDLLGEIAVYGLRRS